MRKRATSPSATAPPFASCQACKQEFSRPDEPGWECECGVSVCQEAECFDEYFKNVGGGEGVRCRTCGQVT
jgi:hypothetical protein